MNDRVIGHSAMGTAHLLAGPCRLEVHGGSPGEVERLRRQIGARRVATDGRPDLRISIGSLPAGTRSTIEPGRYAADEVGLILLRGSGKRLVEVRIPFGDLGDAPTVACRSGSAPLPLLVPLVNLIAGSKGVVALHASAFDLDGLGVLVTGWSKSGKTETLLSFAAQGARYIGDEWVYLHPEGVMTGLPEPMRVWNWHLSQLGEKKPQLPVRTRVGLAALELAVAGGPPVDERLPGLLRRARFLAAQQRNVRLPPEELLPVTDRGHLDVVVLTENWNRDEIVVEAIDIAEIVERAATMLPVERAPLLEAYDVYRYAFPGRRSELIDSAPVRERRLLAERMAGRPALRVRHPYPFSFEAMARVLRPHLDALRPSSERHAVEAPPSA